MTLFNLNYVLQINKMTMFTSYIKTIYAYSSGYFPIILRTPYTISLNIFINQFIIQISLFITCTTFHIWLSFLTKSQFHRLATYTAFLIFINK